MRKNNFRFLQFDSKIRFF